MKKINKYKDYLYMGLQIFIGLDIINRVKNNPKYLLISLGLFLIVVVNDYFRGRSFYKNEKKYFSSMALTMMLSKILIIIIGGYTDIYFFIILYELIIYTEGKLSVIFICSEIIIYLGIILSKISSVENIFSSTYWMNNIIDIIMPLMGVLFYFITLIGYKTLGKEKREVERLNKEIEVLTIAKERNRVSQEIHDNLGHSLIALNMNLDVAEKILEKDIVKAKELINKSQGLTKESMDSLRKAVYALKDIKPMKLRDHIEDLTKNIEGVKVELKIDERTEELLPEYKDVILASIKESLTNSIKHGRADRIIIDLVIDEGLLKVIIIDNGLGCSKLVKGNGLIGIESRVCAYGGEVLFNNNIEGFKVTLILPFK